MSKWFQNALFWHVYPLGFLGAEKDALPRDSEPIHRLENFEPWLDYLQNLGCSGLLLGPIFASESHGYDTVDHYRIDSRLGTSDDFNRLVQACKQRNIRLVLDGVFNHVGREFAPFQDVKTNLQSSRYRDWFRIDWSKGHNQDGFSYANFEGHSRLVTLNHLNPEVVEYVTSVITHWLQLGVDGWRLDAAYAVSTEFWRAVSSVVHAQYPDCWLLGEVLHGDYKHFVNASGVDSVTQYELWKGIWSSLNDGNFFELSHALTRHNEFAKDFSPNVFLGNHDVTRISSQLKNSNHLNHALAILLMVPGIPSIYAGDEQALRGKKEHRPGGDDEIRLPFPAGPEHLPDAGKPVHNLHKDLIELRDRNEWIAHSQITILSLANMQIVYEIKAADKSLVVALNIASAPFSAAALNGKNLQLLAGNMSENHTLPPDGWAILSLSP